MFSLKKFTKIFHEINQSYVKPKLLVIGPKYMFTNDGKVPLRFATLMYAINKPKEQIKYYHVPCDFFQLHNNLSIVEDIHFGNFIFCH